jgi:hypothetical protein
MRLYSCLCRGRLCTGWFLLAGVLSEDPGASGWCEYVHACRPAGIVDSLVVLPQPTPKKGTLSKVGGSEGMKTEAQWSWRGSIWLCALWLTAPICMIVPGPDKYVF